MERTTIGLNKSALLKYQRDKVVPKKDSTTGKRAYKHIRARTQPVKTTRVVNKVAPAVRKTSSPKLLRGV